MSTQTTQLIELNSVAQTTYDEVLLENGMEGWQPESSRETHVNGVSGTEFQKGDTTLFVSNNGILGHVKVGESILEGRIDRQSITEKNLEIEKEHTDKVKKNRSELGELLRKTTGELFKDDEFGLFNAMNACVVLKKSRGVDWYKLDPDLVWDAFDGATHESLLDSEADKSVKVQFAEIVYKELYIFMIVKLHAPRDKNHETRIVKAYGKGVGIYGNGRIMPIGVALPPKATSAATEAKSFNAMIDYIRGIGR